MAKVADDTSLFRVVKVRTYSEEPHTDLMWLRNSAVIQQRKLARDKCLKIHRRMKPSKFQIYNELTSITQEEGPWGQDSRLWKHKLSSQQQHHKKKKKSLIWKGTENKTKNISLLPIQCLHLNFYMTFVPSIWKDVELKMFQSGQQGKSKHHLPYNK